MNILEIIIIIVTAALVFWGWRRGFVRKLASLLMLVLSIVLVSAALPYVTEFLKDNTPLYDYIYEQCELAVSNQIGSLWTSLSGSLSDITTCQTGSSADSSATTSGDGTAAGLTRDAIKSLMEQYGYGDYTSLIDSLTGEELRQYAEQVLGGDFSSLLTTGGSGPAAVNVSGIGTDAKEAGNFQLLSETGEASDSILDTLSSGSNVQNEIIDALPIPQVIKNMLINNNNEEGYESLFVTSFQEYLVGSIATLILNAIAFLLAVLLVNVALRVAFMLLNVFAQLPVLGLANRLAGAALGLVEALFLLWIFFLILTVAQTTEVGASLMTMVNSSALLSWLFETNLFLRIVAWAAARFI
ncbi:MAG: CvpA family protein [Lachnospiraceae bacterium]|nr:CvpA family protein [Lachnospiraceae bacterium]